ncbi:MAG: NADH-ubiquinone oxidoreductase-F iron-sulfur binding region domain-containing protein [Dehalococcoidia bacterium]
MNYPGLVARAEEASRARFPRALVQVGGCTRSVGAGAVFDSLVDEVTKRGLAAPVAVAGCDGACFQAPVVLVQTSESATFRLTHVEPADVSSIVDEWLAVIPTEGQTWKGVTALWPPTDEPSGFWASQTRLVLDNTGRIASIDPDDYVSGGGYSALHLVISSLSPEEVIDLVLEADLRGRGGAFFPAARKWQGARATGRSPIYLLVNAEEGEPGIYKDRHIMEGDPFRLLEGIAIAAYAIGAETVYLYINGEAHLSASRMARAMDRAKADGLVGSKVLDSGFGFEIEIRRGAGGYVLGEESALMNSIEGQRNVPRTRPPFPVESGLWGRPTVINNVETLCNLPPMLAEGNSRYAQVGSDSSRGTKIISLSGRVQRPGLVEVAMGSTIREIVYDIGGGPPEGHEVIGVVAGGPSGGLLNADMLDVSIGPGMLDPAGAVLGSGGITVLDDTISPVEVVRRLAAYNAEESCSKCTPCREGTKRMLDILDGLAGGRGVASDLDTLEYMSDIVGLGSLCGLGQMAGGPIKSGLAHFKESFARGLGIK